MKKNTNPNQRIDAPIICQAAATLKDHIKIVSLLRKKPTHTIQFMQKHSLISPTQRIKELHNKGYDIETQKIRAQSIDSRWYSNIVFYVLTSEPPANDNNSEVAA
jgi:hypothetical protein